jgi:formylglycine-generating enzyme required for sulfatase activity
MEVIQRVRVACPRCGSAVAGDFKFCPTCAYRLKTGTPQIEPLPAPRVRSVATLLVAVGGALFLGLLAGIGVWVFRDPPPLRPPSTIPDHAPAIPVEGLTVDTLPRYMRRVNEGVAYHIREKDEEGNEIGDSVPVRVDALDVLMYEVPRSFFLEFYIDVRRQEDEPTLPALASAWDPQTEEQIENSRLYLLTWLWAYMNPTAHAAVRPLPQETREELARRPLPRHVLDLLPAEARKKFDALPKDAERKPIDDFVAAMPFPWSRKLGILLLAPPSWVDVNTWDEFVVELPHGTGALPVTDIPWSSACALAEWATRRTGGAVRYRLPVAGEWVRIAHGNHPPGGPSDEASWEFPWGKALLRHACNNRELYGGTRDPILQPVGTRYKDWDAGDLLDGTTVDGIFDMSGNAREWVLGGSEQRVNGVYRVHYDAEADRGMSKAPTYGGSYLMDLSECRVWTGAEEDKGVLRPDVGFRLVAEPFR